MEEGRDMRERTARTVEERLRSGASRARRDPSPTLRSRIRAAIEAGGSASDAAPRAPRRAPLVAAGTLVAITLGGLAFIASTREDVHPSRPGDRTSSPAPAAPETFARLALAGPRTLRTAVDDPLLAELADIAEDATRTVRYLAGRVPAQLVARPSDAGGR
jgi:hypothetical protein